MYDKTKPDIVSIATPHTLHYEHAMQAVERGCHVLMEKPMVTDSRQAHALRDAVNERGLIMCVAYNTPCTPEFAYLRDLIRREELGQLELIAGHVSQGWLKATAGTWRQDPALAGGGQAYDTGAHTFNSLCWSVESHPQQVFALIDNKGTDVDINSSANIRFENGVFASIVVGGNCAANGAHMAYLFERGKVEIDPWNGSWIRIIKDGQPVKYPPITGEPMQPADNFLDAVQGKAEPRTSPENGVIQAELMDLIYESARTGQPASPDAVKAEAR